MVKVIGWPIKNFGPLVYVEVDDDMIEALAKRVSAKPETLEYAQEVIEQLDRDGYLDLSLAQDGSRVAYKELH